MGQITPEEARRTGLYTPLGDVMLAVDMLALRAAVTGAREVLSAVLSAARRGDVPNRLSIDSNNAFDLVDVFRGKKPGLEKLGDDLPVASRDGTVSVVDLGGKPVFGVNSSVLVRESDKMLGRSWRDRLIEKYPGVLNSQHKGAMPNNSLFHAEAHSLMRAHQKAEGSLPSTVNMYVDRYSCNNCRTVLPLLAKEMNVKQLNLSFKDGTKAVIENGMFRRVE